MLVDYKYLFLYKSFGLEIWITYFQHRELDGPKISWQKEKNNPWEVVKIGNNEIFFTTTHVGRF